MLNALRAVYHGFTRPKTGWCAATPCDGQSLGRCGSLKKEQSPGTTARTHTPTSRRTKPNQLKSACKRCTNIQAGTQAEQTNKQAHQNEAATKKTCRNLTNSVNHIRHTHKHKQGTGNEHRERQKHICKQSRQQLLQHKLMATKNDHS